MFVGVINSNNDHFTILLKFLDVPLGIRRQMAVSSDQRNQEELLQVLCLLTLLSHR